MPAMHQSACVHAPSEHGNHNGALEAAFYNQQAAKWQNETDIGLTCCCFLGFIVIPGSILADLHHA